MNILFTRSNTPLSRAIRAVTGEQVSHCALECGRFAIHSNLYGVHIELSETFRTHTEVVYSVPVSLDWSKVMSTLANAEGKGYDIGALLYLGLRYMLPCLPRKNLWESSGMYLCTEWVTEVLQGKPDSMITPYGLYLQLVEKENN